MSPDLRFGAFTFASAPDPADPKRLILSVFRDGSPFKGLREGQRRFRRFAFLKSP